MCSSTGALFGGIFIAVCKIMWKRGHSDIRLHDHHLIDNLIQILEKNDFYSIGQEA